MQIQFFDFLAVYVFLALNVQISLSSQQQCTVDSVCGKLSNILKKQDYLEKKWKNIVKFSAMRAARLVRVLRLPRSLLQKHFLKRRAQR